MICHAVRQIYSISTRSDAGVTIGTPRVTNETPGVACVADRVTSVKRDAARDGFDRGYHLRRGAAEWDG